MPKGEHQSQTSAARMCDGPEGLIDALLKRGLRVIGPREVDGVITHAPISGVRDLPKGRVDDQAPGQYRLRDGDPDRWFDYVVGPESWKSWLFPARLKLWSAQKTDEDLVFEAATEDWPDTVFFGVRPCELAAIARQRRVFADAPFADPDYTDRLARTLIVVVQCARSAATCFCAAMNTGPRAQEGFDLALTELDNGHFLIEAGSDAGHEILDTLPGDPASPDDHAKAQAVSAAAAASQTRTMPPNVAQGLKARITTPVWDEIAKTCLSCANCTLACPTCFCSDVEDVTDLSGDHAERWQVWDSCFTPDFSYIHGGPVRSTTGGKYRQWMMHKLSYWHDQFDSSGCVGCGRCIAWCPVGIDITAMAQAVMDSPEGEST